MCKIQAGFFTYVDNSSSAVKQVLFAEGAILRYSSIQVVDSAILM